MDADAVLGSWAAALVPDISDMTVFRVFVLVFFTGVTLAGLYLAINPPVVDGPRPTAANVQYHVLGLPLIAFVLVAQPWRLLRRREGALRPSTDGA